jgi:hypothetical protein
MHEPTDNFRAKSESVPPKSQRTDLRKHYFHFSKGYIEAAQATLVIAGKTLPVTVPEQTQYGFTAIGTAQAAAGLRLGARWVLKHEGKRFEVYPQWIHCAADGRVQIGLRRMQELSPESEIGFIQRIKGQFKPDGQWALVMAVVVMILSAAWMMRQISQPPDLNMRGQIVRQDRLSTPHD